jgi:hypothetical protein
MKKFLRWFFVILAAVAATLLGVHEIGGAPISKGYNTGFKWSMDVSHSGLVLTAEPEGGDMVCWMRLKLPAGIADLNAEISTGAPLSVLPQERDGANQWYAITKKSSVAQDRFEWTSGATILLSSRTNPSGLDIKDWYIFPNNKDFDSQHRAKWRHLWFWISLVSLIIACVGVAVERLSKEPSKPESFSPQRWVEQVIGSIDGKDAEESERMRWVLKKVLIERTPAEDAVAALPFKKPREQLSLWFKARDHFRDKLRNLIKDLKEYLDRVSTP